MNANVTTEWNRTSSGQTANKVIGDVAQWVDMGNSPIFGEGITVNIINIKSILDSVTEPVLQSEENNPLICACLTHHDPQHVYAAFKNAWKG